MDRKYNIDDASSGKILEIANHFLARNLSLRTFAKEYCDFSHVTLRKKLLTVLPTINVLVSKQIKEKLDESRAKNIDEDPLARIRTLSAIDLLLKEDLTIPKIAEYLNSAEMTIYRDLTKRAPIMEEISPETQKEILLKLKDHSRYNLVNKGR